MTVNAAVIKRPISFIEFFQNPGIQLDGTDRYEVYSVEIEVISCLAGDLKDSI